MALLMVLLLLLRLGVSVNSDVSLQKRIIGGHNCVDTERRYHVRLRGTNATHSYLCGGSLIHPKWILTTDTCWKIERGWTSSATINIHPGTSGSRVSTVQDTVVFAPDGWKHDIMLLKLRRQFKDDPVARLPDCSYRLRKDDVVQLAGEGPTTTGPNNWQLPHVADVTNNLQCVDMKVLDVSHFLPTYGHIFSASAPNKDACYGDAGSAVMFNGMIYGVITPGVPEYACQSPVFITDVCEYIGWIRATIGLK